jgi:15-cis-phytoene synthase
MKATFDKISERTSKMTTHIYSTSFSLGIRVFKRKYHDPIYAIYGFVRFGDEIVDSFHGFDKKRLLEKFRKDTYEAIEDGISMNPILNSFQKVVNEYNIDHNLIDLFLKSMEMDLDQTEHDPESFKQYILGSAEVVGLMCLQVFVNGDKEWYDVLKPYAMALGSAFQRVNFLRDLNADKGLLGRSYFPGLNVTDLDEIKKNHIIQDIEKDFAYAYEGIMQLPHGARFGVYVAFVYYQSLLRKIKRTHPSVILKKRVRIPNREKYGLLVSSAFRHAYNLFLL